jgi:hypothetical protein
MDARRNTMGTSTGETPVVKSENEARQGVTGHNVRYVLITGLIGVVVLFAVAYLVF